MNMEAVLVQAKKFGKGEFDRMPDEFNGVSGRYDEDPVANSDRCT